MRASCSPDSISKRRRRITSSYVDSPKKNATYKRAFLFLKAQNTVLNSISEMVNKYSMYAPASEKTTLMEMDEWINQINQSKIKDVNQISSEVLTKVQQKLQQPDISSALEKIETMLLTSALSFMRFSSLFFTNQQQQQQTQNDSFLTQKVPKQNSKLISKDSSSTPLVVCRICDELVPLDLFEEHTQSCLAAYKTEAHLTKADNDIKAKIMDIKGKFLDVHWPENRELLITKSLPMLHLVFLLDRALNVQADLLDAVDELEQIQQMIWNLPDNIEFSAFISQSIELVKEKQRHSYALTNAARVLQQTRISGSSSAPTLTNASIRDFNFLKRISAGAYARVFLAQKKKTGDLYAIKVLRRDEVQQKNQMKRVLAEKNILLQFCNQYIVKFYYSIIGRHNLYLVMEYLPGGDLYSLLQNVGCLDEESAKIYAIQIILALRYLHMSGIIHRDLKPDNILIAADGKLKLTDFGLSHIGVVDRQSTTGNQTVSVQDPSLNVAASLVGTPDYIAPEIILNLPHTFTADYWSLGVIIYELLAGEPPFHGETETQTHTNILKGKIDFTDMDISDEAIDFIKSLLKINPKERLGANNFEDILNHPWIKDINIEEEEPPFMPKLVSAEDTGYFEQRYTFNKEDDDDILNDIKESTDFVCDEGIRSFSSMAVNQLGQTNEEVVKKYEYLMSPKSESKSQNHYFSTPVKSSPLVERVDSPNIGSPFKSVKQRMALERRKSHMSPRIDIFEYSDDFLLLFIISIFFFVLFIC